MDDLTDMSTIPIDDILSRRRIFLSLIHANLLRDLGRLDMRRLQKASLSTPKSRLQAHMQTVTVFACAVTSFKVSAQCRKESKSLTPALRAAFLRDLYHTFVEGSSHHSIMNLAGLGMRRLKQASLSTPKSCLKTHKQTVTVFECAFRSSKVPAQCSNAHRTADRVASESIAIASTGCQANHANVFHNLGGLDMRGLMKASLCVSYCPRKGATTNVSLPKKGVSYVW